MKALRAVFWVWLFAQGAFAEAPAVVPECARIVSLAPSITELLFSLDLGAQVVGVTTFCEYPPEAKTKTRIGGLYDINYEAVLRTNPTLVVALDDSREMPAELAKLGLPTEIVSHRTLDGILRSIDTLGRRCGVARQAAALKAQMETAIAAVREKAAKAPVVRVLIVVGRGDIGPVSRNVFISGRDGFYSDLVRIAGGVNVYEQSTSGIANLSPEALVALNPDIILEVIHDFNARGWSLQEVRDSWAAFAFVPAVRDKKIFVLSGDYAVIPGPRSARLLHDIAVILHPELFS